MYAWMNILHYLSASLNYVILYEWIETHKCIYSDCNQRLSFFVVCLFTLCCFSLDMSCCCDFTAAVLFDTTCRFCPLNDWLVIF